MTARPNYRRHVVALALIGGALTAPSIAIEPAQAQCAARTQTGIGSSSVALAQRCGTTVGDLRRANPGRDLNRPGLVTVPGGRNTSFEPERLNRGVAPAPRINATRTRPAAQGGPTYRQPGEPAFNADRRPSGRSAVPYTIRRGDTLSALAARNGVQLDALLRANPGIAPDRLQVGATIRLPQS